MQRRIKQIENIGIVAKQLASIDFPIVFTGGAVVGLLLSENVIADVRPTDDVDVIIGITKYADYVNSQTQLTRLGISNKWYGLAIETAIKHALPDGTKIQLISAPLFVATKLEAFLDRGKQDYIGSHDLEDIIAVVDRRSQLLAEIKEANESVKVFLSENIEKLLNEDDFVDSISAHLPPDPASQEREDIVIERLMEIIAIADDLIL